MTRIPTRQSISNGGVLCAGAGGFTLIELLTVVAIIGILASISFGVIRGINDRAATATAKSELAMLAQALEEYKQYYGTYPKVTVANGDTSANYLYRALNGLLSPAGKLIEWKTGDEKHMNERRFVDNKHFTLKMKETVAVDNKYKPEESNVYVDPWGKGYRYLYDPAWSQTSGYILFSRGPGTDKTIDVNSAGIKDGQPSTDAKAAGFIYANQ